MSRPDGRTADALRPVSFEVDVQPSPAASVQVTFGSTRVLVAASVEEGAPRWKATVNIAGTLLFLIPLSVLIIEGSVW